SKSLRRMARARQPTIPRVSAGTQIAKPADALNSTSISCGLSQRNVNSVWYEFVNQQPKMAFHTRSCGANVRQKPATRAPEWARRCGREVLCQKRAAARTPAQPGTSRYTAF